MIFEIIYYTIYITAMYLALRCLVDYCVLDKIQNDIGYYNHVHSRESEKIIYWELGVTKYMFNIRKWTVKQYLSPEVYEKLKKYL